MAEFLSKNDIRQHFLQLRKNLVSTNYYQSDNLCENALRYFSQITHSKSIGVYSPFKGEVDISYITLQLQEKHLISHPKVLDKESMHFVDSEKSSIVTPEILIIPSVTCDKYLNRIGYGKGYYDKYLEKNNHIFKIAILPEELICREKIPAETHDIRMDLLITESSFYGNTNVIN